MSLWHDGRGRSSSHVCIERHGGMCDVSPEAFMEELCAAVGGYGRFFWNLVMLYVGWWASVAVVLALLLDHHRCEAELPLWAWLLYGATLAAMLAMSVLLELAMVQRLGLLPADKLSETVSQRRWQISLISTVLWKVDSYMDMGFIFVARDCGSSLWQASFATVIFGVVLGQMLLNIGFAFTDCDHELPSSFGFFLLDFKLVNTAVRSILPFDPDFTHLPVGRPVTLRTTRHLIGMEKVISDIAQVSIQIVYMQSTQVAQPFVVLSVMVGILHGSFLICVVLREYVEDERREQARHDELGTALLPSNRTRSLEIRPAGLPKSVPAARPHVKTIATAPEPINLLDL